MLLQTAAPSSTLQDWIHSFRKYTFAPADVSPLSCLPGTGAELWLPLTGNLGDSGQQVGAGLICPRERRLVLQQKGLQMFVVRFRAGALPFFTQRPLAELIDRYTSIYALWSESGVSQLFALQHSLQFEEQCLLAERFLITNLRPNGTLEHMLQLSSVMYEECANFALNNYAEQMDLDRSHLSRKFRSTQGISAKHFHRLCRFERFIRDALYSPVLSLAGLAIEHGYCDQAHMQHDIQRICRQSPRILLNQPDARLFYSPRLRPSDAQIESRI